MALLNFKTAMGPIKLSLFTGAVPVLMGERGIGKTSIVRSIANDIDAEFFHIDGNLLKEGEIGGLPTVVDGSNNSMQDFMKYCNTLAIKGKKSDEKDHAKLFKMFYNEYIKQKKQGLNDVQNPTTVYATYWVLERIIQFAKVNPTKKIILFIDEINRCEHAVQQELMNLILNREINGCKLPETVMIITAANPSAKYSEFKDVSYQVVDMDEAQEDRMRWFFVGSDEKVWLDWGSKIVNEETGETKIHPDVLEFIASNPDLLDAPNSNDDVKPSPRSWERFSNSFKYFEAHKNEFAERDLYNICRGDLGPSIATSFTQYLHENLNPLIKPEEIFEDDKADTLPQKVKDRVISESFPRQLMVVKNSIRYVLRHKKTQHNLLLMAELVIMLPKDVMVMVMMNILSDHRELHNKLVDNDLYLDTFIETDALVD